MLSSLLTSLYRRLGVRSLGTKFLALSVVLVLISVIGGTIVFALGHYLMRRSLLERQLSTEADGVIDKLGQRAEATSNAGKILADALDVADALKDSTDPAELALSDRARGMRDRFDLALVQIYDRRGLLRAEIARSGIHLDDSTTSSLLNLAEPGRLVTRAAGGQVFMLYRATVRERAGTVVVGTDLVHELRQIREGNGLSTDLGVALRGTEVATVAGLPFDAQGSWEDDQHARRWSMTLGATPAELLLVRSGSDIEQGSRAGLLEVVGSMLFATLLLSGLNVTMVRSMERHLDTLSAATQAVGQGDLTQEISLTPNVLTIGVDDELGLLADSLNGMISGLRDLRSDLEARVEAHAAGLLIAAGISQAVSPDFELDAILSRSAQLIIEHVGRVCPEVHHVGLFLADQGSETVVLEEVASRASEDPGWKSVRVPVGSQSHL